MLARLTTLLLLFIVFSGYSAYSQCCSAGNPVSSDAGASGPVGKTLVVSESFRHSYSDTYYEGSKVADYQYVDRSYFNFSSFGLSYGLNKRISFSGEIGYFYNKTQVFGPPVVIEEYLRKSKGLGDAAFSVRVLAFEKKGLKVLPSVGITVPVGKFDQVYNNVLLPIDIQPSSGNFKYKAGIAIKKELSFRSSLLFTGSAEFSQAIHSERTKDYKYGDIYLSSIIYSYKATKDLALLFQVQNQYRGKAADKGTLIDATGGNLVLVTPQVSWLFAKVYNISALIDIPVYRFLNGPQLGNKYAFAIQLRRNIMLKKDSCEE